MAQAPKPIRSPNYPNMSLKDAVEQVGKIERHYRSAPVDRLNAVKLLGYSSLSGPAQKALAALASYGLVDRAGKGETRVTELARDILHASSQEDRKAKLRIAALEPDLFREIKERFQAIPVPPEEGVITFLNRQGFNPNAVRPAAKAFLQSMSYLEEIGANDSDGDAPAEDEESGTSTRSGAQMDTQSFQSSASNAQRRPPEKRSRMDEDELPPGFRKEIFTLDEGDAVLIFPETMSVTSYGDLEDHLKLFLRKTKRRAEAEQLAYSAHQGERGDGLD